MLKKSIFGQLFSFTTIVLLVCLLFVGSLLFGSVGSYFTQQNEKELKVAADRVNKIITMMIENNSQVDKTMLKQTLDFVSMSTDNAFVCLLDANGQIIINSGETVDVKINEKFYKDIFQKGKEVKYIGDLGGFFSTKMLTVGQPVKNEEDVMGVLFLSVAVPEIHQMRADIFQIFLTTSFFVLVIAVVFNYFISKKITKPLSELGDAAKKIASGDFKERVNIKNTTNEIDELGEIFNLMADSIEQLEYTRQSFVSNVSHELRTPMTTIIGFVEGIVDGTIPPERHSQYLSIVLDESRRLSRLVSDLLAISRMEEGRFNLELRSFDINELVRLGVIKSEKRITDKNIQLTLNFETDNMMVVADKDSIIRVLTNIIDNAIKFTPAGGFIDIKTGREKGKIYTSITNSGDGIAEAELSHVFDRFYKTDKSRSEDQKGVGLGLYIVKSLLKAHGENIWAESNPGEFARFTFTLKPKE